MCEFAGCVLTTVCPVKLFSLLTLCMYVSCTCEQCVPYLICMSSDVDINIRLKADQQLLEIDKKYTGFIQVTVVLSQ